MRTLILSVGLLLSVCLAGCAGSVSTVTLGTLLATDTKAADTTLQSGRVERAVLSVELSEADLERVIRAFDSYALSRSILSELANDPALLVNSVGEIQAEHARLRAAYLDLQTVVANNWEQYDPANQARLEHWRAQAEKLERRYQRFVVAIRTQIESDARQEAAVQLLKIVAQIALVAA